MSNLCNVYITFVIPVNSAGPKIRCNEIPLLNNNEKVCSGYVYIIYTYGVYTRNILVIYKYIIIMYGYVVHADNDFFPYVASSKRCAQ